MAEFTKEPGNKREEEDKGQAVGDGLNVGPADPYAGEFPRPAHYAGLNCSMRDTATTEIDQGSCGAAEISVPAPKSLAKKFAHTLSTALKTGAVWAGAGSAVVCVGTSIIGVIGHTASTLWTLGNELRTKRTSSPHRKAELESSSKLRRGYLGMTRDLLRSPGINMAIGGAAYAAAATQSAVAGHGGLAVAFSSFVIAQAAVTAIANRDYRGERTDQTLLEKSWRFLWKAVPERLQNVFRNPAPWFSIGNMMLVLPGLIEKGFAANPLPQALLAAGIAVAAGGLVRGLSVLFTGKEGAKPTGFASYMMGLGNFLMGVSCLMQGNVAIGLANLCWTASNTLWGIGLEKDRKNTAQQA